MGHRRAATTWAALASLATAAAPGHAQAAVAPLLVPSTTTGHLHRALGLRAEFSLPGSYSCLVTTHDGSSQSVAALTATAGARNTAVRVRRGRPPAAHRRAPHTAGQPLPAHGAF